MPTVSAPGGAPVTRRAFLGACVLAVPGAGAAAAFGRRIAGPGAPRVWIEVDEAGAGLARIAVGVVTGPGDPPVEAVRLTVEEVGGVASWGYHLAGMRRGARIALPVPSARPLRVRADVEAAGAVRWSAERTLACTRCRNT